MNAFAVYPQTTAKKLSSSTPARAFIQRIFIIQQCLKIFTGLSFGLISALSQAGVQPPFTITANLFDNTQPQTLGLKPPTAISNVIVFHAIKDKAQYNHGAVLFPFKGKLYIQWQSSKRDEDAPDTQILYSRSDDGIHWQPAQTLSKARHAAHVTSGGWWSDGNTLIAYINVWPNRLNPKGGYVEYIRSDDGIHWSVPAPLKNAKGQNLAGVIEQDLKSLPGGRILTAVHMQPGLIAKPYYTDDPLAISGWTQGVMENLPHPIGISRELEPSWFLTADKNIVMVFRDQGGSYKVLAAESRDAGNTWSTPVATNMSDSRAKQSAGNLPDGTAYLINNPSGSKRRIPLVLTLSNSGRLFDKAYLLRGESSLPPMQYPGKYKRIGFSYPKSIVWHDRLWVSYAVNKEDINLSSVSLTSLHTPTP